MKERYEILLWKRVDGALVLERKLSRGGLRTAVDILVNHQKRAGIVGIAIYEDGELFRNVGDCGEYSDCDVFVPEM